MRIIFNNFFSCLRNKYQVVGFVGAILFVYGSGTAYASLEERGVVSIDELVANDEFETMKEWLVEGHRWNHDTDSNSASLGPEANNSLAIGWGARINATQSVAIGIGATIFSHTTNALALGSAAMVDSYANNGVAVGYNAKTRSDDGITLGSNSFIEKQARSSVALGTNAKVAYGAANAVAIGSNSIADEENTISFGSKSNQRRLVNISKGIKDTDAVNISQLKDVVSSLGGNATIYNGHFLAPSYRLTTPEGGVITKDNVGDALTYLDDRVKTNKTSIVNLSAKTQRSFGGVAKALGGNAIFDNAGVLQQVNFKMALGAKEDITNVYDAFANVGASLSDHDKRIDMNTVNFNNLKNEIKAGANSILKVEQDIESGYQKIVIDASIAGEESPFDFGGRQLIGAKNGAIDKHSTEVINGSQIYSISSSIATILGGDAQLNNDGTLKAPVYTLNSGQESYNNVGDALLNVDKRISNNKTDIINLETRNNRSFNEIAKAFGKGVYLDDNGIFKGINFKNALGSKEDIDNVYDAFVNINGTLYSLDRRIMDNTQEIANINSNVNSIVNGYSGLIQLREHEIVIMNDIKGVKNIGVFNIGSGVNSEGKNVGRVLEGVATGQLTKDSQQAVNGSQLYDTNKKIDGIANALGGGAGIDEDGQFIAPNYQFKDDSSHTTVGSALNNLDNRVDTLENRVEGISNGTEGLVKLKTDEHGNQKLVIDNALASAADTLDISNEEEHRILTGVKDGKISKESADAINGSQLYETNKSLADIFGGGAKIDQDGYITTPEYIIGDKKFNNVGDSLHHLAESVKSGEMGLFQLDREQNQIMVSDNTNINENTVLHMGNHKIVGVMNGKVEEGSLESVNGGQLWEVQQVAEENSSHIKHLQKTMGHYSARLDSVEKTVDENRRVSSAGISAAMAMSSIPYIESSEHHSFGMGIGTYDGEAAISAGFLFNISENARFKLQGSYDTKKKTGIGAGIAILF